MYGQEGVFEMNLAGNRSVVVCSWEQAHSHPIPKTL